MELIFLYERVISLLHLELGALHIQSCGSKKLLGNKMVTKVRRTWCLTWN